MVVFSLALMMKEGGKYHNTAQYTEEGFINNDIRQVQVLTLQSAAPDPKPDMTYNWQSV